MHRVAAELDRVGDVLQAVACDDGDDRVVRAKDALFADFKAVKEGNVWCTGKSFYQATDIVGEMIRDIHHVLTDGDESAMTFLTKVS